MISENTMLCPSSKGEEGAILLGVVNAEQKIDFISSKITVNQNFVEENEENSLEKKYRFANRCVKNGCSQWKDHRCGVIDLVMKFNSHLTENNLLPSCSIRSQCRWFNQIGEKSCAVCPFIITNSMEKDESRIEFIESNELEITL